MDSPHFRTARDEALDAGNRQQAASLDAPSGDRQQLDATLRLLGSAPAMFDDDNTNSFSAAGASPGQSATLFNTEPFADFASADFSSAAPPAAGTADATPSPRWPSEGSLLSTPNAWPGPPSAAASSSSFAGASLAAASSTAAGAERMIEAPPSAVSSASPSARFSTNLFDSSSSVHRSAFAQGTANSEPRTQATATWPNVAATEPAHYSGSSTASQLPNFSPASNDVDFAPVQTSSPPASAAFALRRRPGAVAAAITERGDSSAFRSEDAAHESTSPNPNRDSAPVAFNFGITPEALDQAIKANARSVANQLKAIVGQELSQLSQRDALSRAVTRAAVG